MRCPAKHLFCIAGTDTDVGKTIVTAALARIFSRMGVQAVKAVQTGCAPQAGEAVGADAQVYADAAPRVRCHVLHSFALPASPHLAAEQARKRLTADGLTKEIQSLAYMTFSRCSRNEGKGQKTLCEQAPRRASNMEHLASTLHELKAAHLYRTHNTFSGPQQPWTVINGRKMLLFSSNNYLGPSGIRCRSHQ